MKKIYISLATIFIGLASFGQTSVQNGNWTNPTTWDCMCVPSPFFTAIDIVVNHTVTVDLNTGAVSFEGGSLTIGANGALIQSGAGDLYMKNAVTLVNGTLDMRRIAIEGGTATYNGVIQNCDSLWSDSSIVVNNGVITCYDHQVYPEGEMTNNGTIRMTHDMNIQGEYTNGSTGIIYIDNDFSNANTFGGRALYINNGDHQIANDFINTTNDTIKGSGIFCIGGLSTNQGKVLGTVTFTTSTGGFNFNSGFVAPTVNFQTGACSLLVNENEVTEISVYPNPFSNFFTITGVDQITNIELFDLNGKLIQVLIPNNKTIDVSGLETGIYLLKVITQDSVGVFRKIIKE